MFDLPTIIIENTVDSEAIPPSLHVYSESMHLHPEIPDARPPDVCCDCPGASCARNPSCACKACQTLYGMEVGLKGFMYTQDGRLKDFEGIPIFECHEGCLCNDRCRNRVVQLRRRVHIKIAKTKKKGWGSDSVRKGTFIGTYSGEYISESEAQNRLRSDEGTFIDGGSFIFDLDFHHLLDFRPHYMIDGGNIGNTHKTHFTRTIRVSQTVVLLLAMSMRGNLAKALIAIFTEREIHPGEELTLSYFGSIQKVKANAWYNAVGP
ncbi:hypothetical protein EV421DRAFT_1740681 [Armillaria borealis]|uniref:Pre-SET domain-containing protein n=1 Tax=Armillaria borealis TaxID=47425 RepID=A0AA39J3Y7_9AGAR|nr:hypothetical protein EV421DRAFT_1740681 [Armillaria borealis]